MICEASPDRARPGNRKHRSRELVGELHRRTPFQVAVPGTGHGPLHAHDLIAGVHVDDLAGDGGGAVAGQKDTGGAEFLGQDIPLERGVGLVMLEHFAEAG